MSTEMKLPEGVFQSNPHSEAPAVVREYINDAGQALQVWVKGIDGDTLAVYLESLVIAFGTWPAEEIEEQEIPPNPFEQPPIDEPPAIEVRFEFPGIVPPFNWGVAVDPTILGFKSDLYVGP